MTIVLLQSLVFSMQYIFCQNVRVLPDCILCPTTPSFSNYPALSPSPYLRKLIHLTIHKNTTPYPTNNPANPPGIKISAREGKRFQRYFRCPNKVLVFPCLQNTPENGTLCASGICHPAAPAHKYPPVLQSC